MVAAVCLLGTCSKKRRTRGTFHSFLELEPFSLNAIERNQARGLRQALSSVLFSTARFQGPDAAGGRDRRAIGGGGGRRPPEGGCLPFRSVTRNGSVVVLHFFRSGSSLLPQWYFASSAVVLHCFRSGS